MMTSRNAPCPCGSGKKYKRCCLRPSPGTRRVGEGVPTPSLERTRDGVPRNRGTPQAEGRTPSLWVTWMYPLGLLLAGIVAYTNSFQGSFVFDDRYSILENIRIRSLWPLWSFITGTPRPLVELTLALNYAVGRLNPWGYHAVNLAIHLAAGLLLYGLLRRTLVAAKPCRQGNGEAEPLAFAVSLLWLLHPLQTQSVTYLIQRAESLMGLCYLATLYAVCRSATPPHQHRWWGGLAITACALGMLTKPVMVTAPLLCLLYDRTFGAGSIRAALRERRGLYLGLAATWLLLAAVLTQVQEPEEATAGFRFKEIAPLAYAATQPGVLLHYLRLTLWPNPLVLDYDWPLARTWEAILPPLFAIGALLGFSLWAFRRRATGFGFLGLAFFLLLAPTSSLIPIADLIFEYRMYLPLAPLLTLLVLGVHRLLRATPPHQRGWWGGTLLILATFSLGLLTARRNLDYRSESRIWYDTVMKQPTNVRAYRSFGYAVAQEGRNDVALSYLQHALRLDPTDEGTLNNLGLVLTRLGRLDEAIATYREAIRIKPKHAQAYSNLGLALMKLGRVDEAIETYHEAVRLQPTFVVAHNNLGIALAQQGYSDEAIEHYRTAIRHNPEYAEAHLNLGIALTELGRADEAATHYRQALRISPKYAEAHANLGVVLFQQSRIDEAVQHLRKALELNPTLKEARANLERIRSESP